MIILSLMLTGCSGQAAQVSSLAENALDAGDSREEGQDQAEVEQPENVGMASEVLEVTAEAGYPIFAQLNDRIVSYVMESEGIYCVYGHQDDQGSYFGFVTVTGEEIAPFIYQAASPFSQGLACVCLDGKYGYIDKNGETVFPFHYDYATPFSEGLAYFAIGDTYGFMDKSGEQVFTLDCDSVSSFQEGLAYFSVDGKYGYIDQTGTIVIQPVYDDADYFRDGYARVRIGGKLGVIDAAGREVLLGDYGSVSIEDGYILAEADDRNFCFALDGRDGAELLLAETYIDKLQGAGRPMFRFYRDGKFGLADGDGTVLIQPVYDFLAPLENWELVVAEVTEDGETKYGLLDLKGDVAVPFGEYEYSYSYEPANGELLMVTVEEEGERLRGFLDLKDMTLRIPAIYQDTRNFQNGSYTWVSKDGRYGVIDRWGELVFPMIYERARVLENGAVVLWEGEEGPYYKVSLYSDSGQQLYEAEDCWDIYLNGECYEIHMGNGRILFLDSQGTQVGKEYFDRVVDVTGGQSNLSIGRYDSDFNYVIVQTGSIQMDVTEMEGTILKNAVTPRNFVYYQVFLERMGAEIEYGVGRPLFRLYLVDGCEEPVLYYYVRTPYDIYDPPASRSSIYRIREGQAVEIVSGEQFSDIRRGDYATLWYDRETEHVLPGMNGYWNYIDGYSEGGSIYSSQENNFRERASFHYIRWDNAGVVDEEFRETPELFYDDYGRPYSADRQPESYESVTEYRVDGEQTTIERYREATGRYEELYSVWY